MRDRARFAERAPRTGAPMSARLTMWALKHNCAPANTWVEFIAAREKTLLAEC